MASSPAQSAADIAKLVASILRDSVDLGPYVAVPFMVSGLYGVVPYFVIDVSQAKKIVDAVVTTIVEALIAALLAYLAAKKLLEDFWDSMPDAVKAFAAALLIVGLGIELILALPEAVVVAAAAAVLMLIFSGDDADQQSPGGDPSQNPNGTIYLGPLVAKCTPAQFTKWVSTALTNYLAVWSQKTNAGTVPVAAPTSLLGGQ